ncbi:MAG: flagellar motor switch protein FliN [Firmicutes bacterium]|nr:flagellar motor switch protein FliN [Alicyclobacillaceae bacterium]MCL6497316.1 flagellar motor switch protein FliN [Bacillota bacterium]
MAKKPARLTAEEVAELLKAGDNGDSVEIRRVEFAELEEPPINHEEPPKPTGLSFLWDIPMTVEVVLGETELTVRDVMAVGVGTVIELNRSYGEPVDVYLNGRLVARGEVVTAGEQFGVKIKEILVSSEEMAEPSGE